MSGLTKSEIKKWVDKEAKIYACLMDCDGDLNFSIDEIKRAFRPLNSTMYAAIGELHVDDKEQIGMDQFIELLYLKIEQEPRFGLYRVRFNALNIHGGDCITTEDLKAGYRKWKGEDFDAERFIKRFDRDGDGKIDFHEYVKKYEGDDCPDPDVLYKKYKLKAHAEFSNIDKDGNGTIDKVEVQKHFDDMLDLLKNKVAALKIDDKSAEAEGMRAQLQSRETAAREGRAVGNKLWEIDVNDSGQISFDEFFDYYLVRKEIEKQKK